MNPLQMPGCFCFLQRKVILVDYFKLEKWRKMLFFWHYDVINVTNLSFVFYIVQHRTLGLLPLLWGLPEKTNFTNKIDSVSYFEGVPESLWLVSLLLVFVDSVVGSLLSMVVNSVEKLSLAEVDNSFDDSRIFCLTTS